MQFQELSFIGLMFSHQSLSFSKKSLENNKYGCKKFKKRLQKDFEPNGKYLNTFILKKQLSITYL